MLIPLKRHSLLVLRGVKARDFMQGQSTPELIQIKPNQVAYGACCNPKGRTIGVFMLAQLPNASQNDSDLSICLRMPAQMVPLVQDFLKPYAMLSRVALEDGRNLWSGFGLCGARALAQASALWKKLPKEIGYCEYAEQTLIIKRDHERLECWCPHTSYQDIHDALANTLQETHEAHWDLCDVRAGMPDIYPATSGQFIPQTLNLEAWQGISYTKGCYTGQEVIARMHHLGKSKRACLHAMGTGNTPQAGDSIYNTDSASCGEIIRAAPLPDTDSPSYELLAVAPDDTDQNKLYVKAKSSDDAQALATLKILRKLYPN